MPGFIFARQLARDFNRPDYFNMLRSMSSTELDHWYDYHRDKPMRGDAQQLQLAQIAAATCGGKVADFIPEYRKPKTEREQIAIWQSLA